MSGFLLWALLVVAVGTLVSVVWCSCVTAKRADDASERLAQECRKPWPGGSLDDLSADRIDAAWRDSLPDVDRWRHRDDR